MTLHLGAAVAAIASIREDLAQHTGCTEWDGHGIRAALIATEGAPGDVLAAASLAAGDATLRLPSEKAFRAHWPKNASAAARVSHNQPCPDHPTEHDMPCPVASTLTPEQVAQLAADARAALAAARTAPTTRKPEPDRLTESIERLEQVRALIPEETP